MPEPRYLLDNAQPEAAQRFDALSELFNPATFATFERLGVGPGTSVWEVGAGGPSVPRWLAARTGGSVLATDLDTRWLDHDASYAVLEHDIATDPPPRGGFDVVHARLVLVHVTDRTKAISTMVEALNPGGWLFLEEADPGLQPLASPDAVGEAEVLANWLKSGFRALMAERGVDLAFGRTLPRLLRQAGLTDVSAQGAFPLGGPICAALERATTLQIRQQLLDAALATEEDIAAHLSNVDSGTMDLCTSPMVSAWGRHPGFH